MAEAINYGGRAHLHGVSFHSSDVTVTAKRIDGEIIVEDDADLEEYEYYIEDKISFMERLRYIPFIRGFINFFQFFSQFWKFFVIALAISLPIVLLVEARNGEEPVLTDETNVYIRIATLIVIIAQMKFLNIGKYHAAEHMIANCYDKGLSVTIENAMKQSRVHKECGSIFYIYYSVNVLLLHILPWINELHTLFILILAWSIAYEMFGTDIKFIDILLRPLLYVGCVLQYIFLTSKPTEEHVQVALAAFTRLLEIEEQIEKQLNEQEIETKEV
ncbi:DUF1385 domain-containing protein [Priestia taiwanensis]|uniref:DUF1385 domain-containing protein n=1 Tax=Priestia taiwanensis TaxID=1347902 RepID=A0A917ELV7_9BACI|nr:DUF1385 domain-containing protein [Priestia taiwanensis]MBM7361519.1 uncharacterized protein YqhQ [Priestia taiwanensis]GGE54817.1 hypothetical protein GCM10007140_01410 [Priestia taiwanensis]